MSVSKYQTLTENFVYNYNYYGRNSSASNKEMINKVFIELLMKGINKTELVFSDVVVSRAAILNTNLGIVLDQSIWNEKGPISIEQFKSLTDNMPIIDNITTEGGDWTRLMSERIKEIKEQKS